MIDVIANERGSVLPQWVNEGFAVWSENGIDLHDGQDQVASRSWVYYADTVRLAALSGDLMTLSSLESSDTWQGRTGDQVTLQYAESYMAVRYLTETYGESAIVDLISDFSRRGNLSLALAGPAGISYPQFETQFKSWLEEEEPTDRYFQSGSDRYSAGEYQEAIDEFSAMIEIDPDSGVVYNIRGLAYYQLEEYQLAVDDFAESIRLAPYALVVTNRGSSYYQLGQYRRAIDDFDQSIRLDPDNARAYDWRAFSYGKLGEAGRQRADRDKACSLDSRYC